MMVALFNPETGKAEKVINYEHGSNTLLQMQTELALNPQWYGYTSRVLDGTQYEGLISCAAIPDLNDLDQELIQSGLTPQSVGAPT